MKTIACFIMLITGCSVLHAAPRASTDYGIPNDNIDSGGQHASSADGLYGNDGNVGQIGGVSSAADAIVRAGFMGQLYELVGYGLFATDYYPNELGTTQIIPVRTADDGTNVAIATTGITFTILGGPLTGITSGGHVTAGVVAENTTAFIGATAAFMGQLELPLYVQDTIPDNFGSYAGDGIGDDWQFLHFGLDNPLAAPLHDPDYDGQSNLFEYTAGLLPLDPASRFMLEIHPGLAANQQRLIFHPCLPDRTYTLKASTSMSGLDWQPLSLFNIDIDNDVRTITDLDATGAAKFYHVEITKP